MSARHYLASVAGWLSLLNLASAEPAELVRATVVARSLAYCVSDGDASSCRESFILAVKARGAKFRYLIVEEQSELLQPRISDARLANRMLQFNVRRDPTCDRVVTFEPQGWQDTTEGCERTYDWTRIQSHYPQPRAGVPLQCYRLLGTMNRVAGR